MSRGGWFRRCHAVLCLVAGLALLSGCAGDRPEPGPVDEPDAGPLGGTEESDREESGQAIDTPVADVISVEVTGSPGAYQFSVQVASPDEGCDLYADWWEVLTEGGELVYRRILAHSHVAEQPFERSGGPVAIEAGTVVLVRAHVHPGGYGGRVMKGTVEDGFEEVPFDPAFGPGVEREPPQPEGCAF